jgi:hypothetical protein
MRGPTVELQTEPRKSAAPVWYVLVCISPRVHSLSRSKIVQTVGLINRSKQDQGGLLRQVRHESDAFI